MKYTNLEFNNGFTISRFKVKSSQKNISITFNYLF